MLIKNTNLNELLAEFERDKNFCPYNEEELERLKKEAERLRKDVTCNIGIWNNETYFSYGLLRIQHKEMLYEYGEYGSIREIRSVRETSFAYPIGYTERVQFEKVDKIVFFYESKNSDGSSDWLIEVTREDGKNLKGWLWTVEEDKFKRLGVK